MIWYIRLGAFIGMAIAVAPFIIKLLKFKDQEESEDEGETPE